MTDLHALAAAGPLARDILTILRRVPDRGLPASTLTPQALVNGLDRAGAVLRRNLLEQQALLAELRVLAPLTAQHRLADALIVLVTGVDTLVLSWSGVNTPVTDLPDAARGDLGERLAELRRAADTAMVALATLGLVEL
ncbi:MAG: hypothetical protein ABIQ18_04425 [Umezawaea sp.]